MFAFGMPGGMEWVVIAAIAFVVFILPLTLLGIIVAVLAKRRKKAIAEEPVRKTPAQIEVNNVSESTR